ncbi:uncharacterized protein LOC142978339 isoform X2 [Anticarsia gemmatalis]|uniref:uncharacterized protein LOC142978339 isoform X2 n=1 Tax=Anticarsia gemmatalis TaxID=129554 RepID=UPI003F763EE1
MLAHYVIIVVVRIAFASSYSNTLFTIGKANTFTSTDFLCDTLNNESKDNEKWPVRSTDKSQTFQTVTTPPISTYDPVIRFQKIIRRVLYGKATGDGQLKLTQHLKEQALKDGVDMLAHLPSGKIMRAVTLPFVEYIHHDHAYLKLRHDYMQTAVDAFAIFLAGTIADIKRLPRSYVLRSARTIAMMRIPREKLMVTWAVVKGSTPTEKISIAVLEQFRPLFKYVNGKEMARLNLLDNKILSYLGTHPDLNRHQVGVIASKYLQLNKNWTQPRYLNIMKNLLCGIPMMFMRRIPRATYMQLSHQMFYHIHACEPLQRRFYLQMMTRTQALGKSYSWTARDVSQLGLLLADVDGKTLSAVNPEAMAGITSQVMLKIPPQTLQHVTEMQLRYLEPKALNILTRKLYEYQSERDDDNAASKITSYLLSISLLCAVVHEVI